MQSQVDEVIDVMQENISKVIERGERLDDLQDKSGESYRDSLHLQSVSVCLFPQVAYRLHIIVCLVKFEE